ncbi:MAG: glycogen debranching protein GlgX [Actinomycetota bacterium]|nr:glycogen debranching protein GlgX [Actinomycetota bacterium]
MAHTHARPGWDPLGVTPDGNGGVNVALWAEGAELIQLCLFDEAGVESRIDITHKVFNIFHGHVHNVPIGTRYGFRVHGPWDPNIGHRWNPNKLLIDPYARAIEGELALDPSIFGHVGTDDLAFNVADSAEFMPRSIVVDSKFDWGDDKFHHVSWGDTVIYEAHVKGLTKLHPGIPEHQRGTYAGVAHPLVVEHLKSLGVTSIELMPVHQFFNEIHLLETGLTNYWGYNSIGYFAPHALYSSTGTRGEQVNEFKQMVKDLHAAGLEVILDVVYNHTAEGNEMGPTLSFRGIDNDDYYRLRDSGRHYTDYTGTGNTLDISKPHVLQLVMDSLRYWVTEMHVDGFRFDLASALARSMHDVDMLGTFMSTIHQDPVLRRVKLIAEPWDVGPGGYQVGEFPSLWTEWNGKYRDCIRDFWRGATGISEVGWRLTGSADLYASEGRRPFASINFITAHDGFTMNDLVSYETKHNEANLENNRDGTNDNRSRNYGVEGPTEDLAINGVRDRQLRNLFTTLALSTGVPMFTAGDEFGRTQRGNNNAYCQDNEISWIEWQLTKRQADLLAFNQQVMQIRKLHRAFRQRYFFDGRPMTEGGPKDLAWIGPDGHEVPESAWHDADQRTLGMYIAGDLEDRLDGPPVSDDSFLLIMHAGEEELEFTLPGKPYGASYRRILDSAADQSTQSEANESAGGVITMAPLSLVLFRVSD